MISPALIIFTKGLLHTLGLITSALENNLHFIKGWAFNWEGRFCWNLFTQAVLTVVKYWGIDFKHRGHRASVWATCRRRFRRTFSIKSGVGFSGKIVMYPKLFCVVMLLASSAQPPRRRKRKKNHQVNTLISYQVRVYDCRSLFRST